jgi:hypothetical protein
MWVGPADACRDPFRAKGMPIEGTEPEPSKYLGHNPTVRSIETDLMISLRLPEARLPATVTRPLLLPPVARVVRHACDQIDEAVVWAAASNPLSTRKAGATRALDRLDNPDKSGP